MISPRTLDDVDLVLSLASTAILVYLLYTYVRLYVQLRQRFTLGLILFASLILIHNISGTFFLLGRQFGFRDRHGPPPGNFTGPPHTGFNDNDTFLWLRLVPTFLQFAALIVLAWLTRE